MNTRSLTIVETLLDLHEDLNSRMAQLKQQFPEYTDDQILQMSQADPTSPQQADYITWLLRLRRRNAWDGSVEPVRSLLARFEEIKQARFNGYVGQRDIGQIESVDELAQLMEANKLAGTRKERASGTQVKAKEGDLTNIQMLTPEAAVKFSIGNGTPNQPEARWCTSSLGTARGYIVQGPLFVVMKGKSPYAQIHFASNQAKNLQNNDVNLTVAEEIAPLFSDPSFDRFWSTFQYRPAGWIVNDSHIKNRLMQLIKRWYSEKLEGYTNARTGEWIAPAATTLAEARESLRGKLKSFFDLFAAAVAKQDEQIIRQLGERHGAAGGLQAMFNFVFVLRNPQSVQLPPLLQDYGALEAMFDELAAKHEQESYRGRQ